MHPENFLTHGLGGGLLWPLALANIINMASRITDYFHMHWN